MRANVKYQLAQGGSPPAKPEKKEVRNTRSAVGTLILLAMAGAAAVGLGWFFYWLDSSREMELLSGLFVHLATSRYFDIKFGNTSMIALSGRLATRFKDNGDIVKYDFVTRNESYIHVAFNNQVNFISTWTKRGGISIYDMEWLGASCSHEVLEDCFELNTGSWYGLGRGRPDMWTLGLDSVPKTAVNVSPAMQGALERVWLTSSGAAIVVPWDVPLWYSVNHSGDGLLCLSTENKPSKFLFKSWNSNKYLHLKYTVYVGGDMTTVSKYLLQYVISHRHGSSAMSVTHHPSPPVSINISPSWIVHTNISHLIPHFMQFNSNISKFGFETDSILTSVQVRNLSALILDDNFTSLEFCTSIRKINREGGHVMIDIEPLQLIPNWSNLDIDIEEPLTFQPSLPSRCMNLFRQGLRKLKECGVHNVAITADRMLPDKQNNIYSIILSKHRRTLLRILSNVSISVFPHTILHSAANMQRHSVYVQAPPYKSSSRELQNIIPEILTMGISGYPFIIAPEFQTSRTKSPAQNHRLFIRWLQLSIFLPALTFSTPPWMLSDNTSSLALDMLRLRESFRDILASCAEESAVTGYPLLRPVWWLDPHDPVAQLCSDQFLLGTEVLVAPILDHAANYRDIYLPRGYWADPVTQITHTGPLWLFDYHASLDFIPYFTKALAPPTPPIDTVTDVTEPL